MKRRALLFAAVSAVILAGPGSPARAETFSALMEGQSLTLACEGTGVVDVPCRVEMPAGKSQVRFTSDATKYAHLLKDGVEQAIANKELKARLGDPEIALLRGLALDKCHPAASTGDMSGDLLQLCVPPDSSAVVLFVRGLCDRCEFQPVILRRQPSSPATDAAMQEAMNALLQADAKRALAVFDRIDPAALNDRRKSIVACVRKRFDGSEQPNDLPPVSSAALRAYQRYWRAVMTHAAAPAKAEAQLLASLNAIPAMAGAKDHASLDSVSDYVVTAIGNEGLHALTGKTLPLYELMIWKREDPRVYDKMLPEGPVKVKVVFLEEFASSGWAAYATCGVAQAGGWAKPDALYAVKESYDLDSESFRVSYLGHEGQHFSDYERYPMLEQPELEYRAKLTELVLSSTTTAALLEKFKSESGPSRDSPHAYAARHVMEALKGVPPDGINMAAYLKLKESSATLERLGPKTTKRFLAD
jgi:hypothetical protein